MKKLLDRYEEKDIVETCRRCGIRTEVISAEDEYEVHECPSCHYKYELVLRNDGQEDEPEEVEVSNIPSKKSKDFWK